MMQQLTIATDIQLLDALESRLGRLAARWRGTHDIHEREGIVRQYQSILNCMVELGYEGFLDADAELPDEYLPAAYLLLHG